jgi:hypothetical protein
MLPVYYRTYVPHTFLASLFGLDDSNVSRSNRQVEPPLAGIFRIPERRVELTREEIRELFFDGTERPTARPVRGQKRFYSGKKRRHTLKTQVVSPGCGSGRGCPGNGVGCGSWRSPRRPPVRPATRRCTTGRVRRSRRG